MTEYYFEILSAMFVDIGDNHSVVDRVKLCYIYDEIDSAEVRINFYDFFKTDEGSIVTSLTVWLFGIFIFVVNHFFIVNHSMILIKIVSEKFRFV